MTEEVSYFEVTSYLAEIEDKVRAIPDEVERTTALVQHLRQKWPGLSADQAVAYIRLFYGTE